MSQIKLASVVGFLESFAPLQLAEDWDNVGLLLGDRAANITKAMTCLTITPEVVQEAVDGGVELIVSHHPMPFRSLKKITSDSTTGQMILELIRNNVAVYSPHTAFDSAGEGINQSIAERLGLVEIQPIHALDSRAGTDDQANEVGVGRTGRLKKPESGQEICIRLKQHFALPMIKFCGDLDRPLQKIGIACGSAGQFLSDAARLGCDAFVTGETNFHTCLESLAHQVSLFLLGHFGSERFAVEMLAERLSSEFPNLSIHASIEDKDPIQYVTGT